MNGHSVAPFLIGYCSICTQRHGPLLHNDMHVLKVLCKGGTPQDDMAMGKDVHTKEIVSSGREEYISHKALSYYFELMRMKSSQGHDKSWCNSDFHKQEHCHTSCHRKILLSLSKPSFSQRPSAAPDKASKQAPDTVGMVYQLLVRSEDFVSFSLVSMQTRR